MEATPNIFVLALKGTLKRRDLETTVIRGPLTIEASDEEAARLLAALNFGKAVRRWSGKDSPACVWNDRATSSCIRVGASVQPSSLKPAPLVQESIDLGDGRTAKILSVCH
jgi:hypothetical protein